MYGAVCRARAAGRRPTVPILADMTGLDEDKVRNAIGGLRDDGFVGVFGKSDGRSWYGPTGKTSRFLIDDAKISYFRRICLRCSTRFDTGSPYLRLCPSCRRYATEDLSSALIV